MCYYDFKIILQSKFIYYFLVEGSVLIPVPADSCDLSQAKLALLGMIYSLIQKKRTEQSLCKFIEVFYKKNSKMF